MAPPHLCFRKPEEVGDEGGAGKTEALDLMEPGNLSSVAVERERY